ncbi:hypothetical protein LWI29_001241 [Acer saccharum]|uniref:Uncharacterized protein n=1 Tax=Acer saccharum TaxID=4024 RepID=A0AA39TCQ2_ACESA|nr:hypothetical protein LWI29_001241 [Acer saccharum]
MEEKRCEREAPDDANGKEMVVIEESDDVNEIEILEEKRREILEASLPPTPIKCENNDSASSSSDQHEQHQPKDSIIDIKELEELMEFLEDNVDYDLKDIHVPVPPCCIYRVPKDLRKINEAAYTPQVISIGPLHHGEKEFFEMEKQKLRYMLEFSKRVSKEKLMEFKRFIEENEQHIRNYYQENSSLPSPKFVSMILHDAVFIIEVFLKNTSDRPLDFFLDTPRMRVAINLDLQLLENQLPYFFLQELFEKGDFQNVTNKVYPDQDPFLILYLKFFSYREPYVFPNPDYEIEHFTDLRRQLLLMDFSPEKEPGDMRDLPIATKLHRSGVKFKKGSEDQSSLKICCKDAKNAIRIPYLKSCELPIPWIKELQLQIPRFEIFDETECLYRNMMALEQCHYPDETHICKFFLLMDYLIDTVKDVDLLVDEGIIANNLGDNAAIVKMFNNLCLQIDVDFSDPYNIIKKLNEHYDNRWNHTMATFKTVYFSDIWTGTATVAAVILLVLTFIETVFSIVK